MPGFGGGGGGALAEGLAVGGGAFPGLGFGGGEFWEAALTHERLRLSVSHCTAKTLSEEPDFR